MKNSRKYAKYKNFQENFYILDRNNSITSIDKLIQLFYENIYVINKYYVFFCRVTIDTLEQLAESSIKCGAWGKQSKLFFESSLDLAGQKIGSKLEHVDDINNAVSILYSYNRYSYVMIMLVTFY